MISSQDIQPSILVLIKAAKVNQDSYSTKGSMKNNISLQRKPFIMQLGCNVLTVTDENTTLQFIKAH
jgi:hypothetical protein